MLWYVLPNIATHNNHFTMFKIVSGSIYMLIIKAIQIHNQHNNLVFFNNKFGLSGLEKKVFQKSIF